MISFDTNALELLETLGYTCLAVTYDNLPEPNDTLIFVKMKLKPFKSFTDAEIYLMMKNDPLAYVQPFDEDAVVLAEGVDFLTAILEL